MAKPSSLCQSISQSLHQAAAGGSRKQQEAAGHGKNSRPQIPPLFLCCLQYKGTSDQKMGSRKQLNTVKKYVIIDLPFIFIPMSYQSGDQASALMLNRQTENNSWPQ